jgi:hypothetical protein
MGNEDHGLYSSSQLEKRMLCPGSVRLEREQEGTGRKAPVGPDAIRGTLLHQVVEYALEEMALPEDRKAELDPKDEVHTTYCIENQRIIEKDYPGALTLSEHQLDLRELGIIQTEHSNRADRLVVDPGFEIAISDWKFGAIPVTPPKYNPQFWAYTWGAWRKFGAKRVRCLVFQPMLPGYSKIREYTFAEADMPIIESNIRGIIAECEKPDAPLVRGEKQCKYCRAKQTCPLHKETLMEIPNHLTVGRHLELISPEERGSLLDNLYAAQAWVEQAVNSVVAFGLNGGEIDGWELSERKSREGWVDTLQAMEILEPILKRDGMKASAVIKSAELKTVNQVRNMIGDRAMRKLEHLIEQPPPKPILKRRKSA